MSSGGTVWIILGIIVIIAVFFFLAIFGFGLVLIIGASASAKSSAKNQAITAPKDVTSTDIAADSGSKNAESETAPRTEEEQSSENS